MHVASSIWFWGMLALFLLRDRANTALWAMLACAWHESGHLWALWLERRQIYALRLHLGGIALWAENSRSRLGETAALLAGSGANFLAAILLWSLGRQELAAIHLCYGGWNLLPFRSLDGGKLLSLWAGERVCRALSAVCKALLLGAGLFVCSQGMVQSGERLLLFSLILLVFCS